MTEYLTELAKLAVTVPGIAYLVKRFIETRLTKSIEAQYARGLESLKAEMFKKTLIEVEGIRNGNQELLESQRSLLNKDVQLQIETLRSVLQMEQQVHSVQFDTEFKVYKELWLAIHSLEHALSALLRRCEKCVLRHVETILYKERTEALGRTLTAFLEVERCIQENKPFYAQTVYQSCKQLLSDATDGRFRIRLADIHEDGEIEITAILEMRSKMMKNIENIEQQIRRRIYRDSVEPIDCGKE